MAVAEQIKARLDLYWLNGYYQYKSDNTISLRCDTLSAWLENDQFYKDLIFGVDMNGKRIAFELCGDEVNVLTVRAVLLGRIVQNLIAFIEWTNPFNTTPAIVVEYESKPIQTIQQEAIQDAVTVEDEVSIIPTKKKKESK